MGKDCVALLDEGSGEELAEVAESDNGDLEFGGGLKIGCELGLVVVELRGVDCSDFEAAAETAE